MCPQVSRAFAIFDDGVTDVIKCDWKIAHVKYLFIIFGKTNDAPQNALQQLKSVSHFVHFRTDMIPTPFIYKRTPPKGGVLLGSQWDKALNPDGL